MKVIQTRRLDPHSFGVLAEASVRKWGIVFKQRSTVEALLFHVFFKLEPHECIDMLVTSRAVQ